jgi:hypothetical protein
MDVDKNDKNDLGLYRKTSSISSPDAAHIVNIKVEVSDVEEEELTVPVTCQAVKAEREEVSCISICPLLSRFHRYSESPVVLLISVSMHLCLHETDPLW